MSSLPLSLLLHRRGVGVGEDEDLRMTGFWTLQSVDIVGDDTKEVHAERPEGDELACLDYKSIIQKCKSKSA